MKTLFNKFGIILIFSILLFSSCRTEETELIEPSTEEALIANSSIANLIERVSILDGSIDNIIDRSNCFIVQLPVNVIVNGIEVTINTIDDYDVIEAIFDEFSDDTDILEIIFPITIILDDFTEVVINNLDELISFAATCSGENEIDDDIECIDFHYPIIASAFDPATGLIETITILNDEQFFELIGNLDEDIIITINFPISVTLWDGSVLVINNLIELQSVIESAINECDEDDDYDYDDDDCDDCSTTQLEDILTSCSNWAVDKLERSDNDLEDIYVGYLFNFYSDGTLEVDNDTTLYTGTWESNGTGNDITVTINVSGLPDFNDVWNLHEIEVLTGESKVDLRLGEDRLRFESDCDSGGGGGGLDDTALVDALTTGDWYITYYFDDVDETDDFNGYVFNFASDGTATATSSGTTNGTWSTSAGDDTALELNLNFGTSIPLDELAEDWDVLEVTSEIIRLKDVSGGDGSEEFLTFERDPGTTSTDDLSDILVDGGWFVSSYIDDGDNETADYNGYELDFQDDGTVVADNGDGTPINGTWEVLSGGNKLLLEFGSSFPFDEFNDDWDVLSMTDTRVELQDVSGGGGGTDTLIFEKL